MKILASEIRPGTVIEYKNDLWRCLKSQAVKPGKGGAFNQVELKSITKGTKLNERFRSGERLREHLWMKEITNFYTKMEIH